MLINTASGEGFTLGFHIVEKLIAVVKLTCKVHGEERDVKSSVLFLNLLTYLRRFIPGLTVYSESQT